MLRFSKTVLLLLFVALSSSVSQTAEGSEPRIVFGRDIRPILSQNCFFCHGPDEASREADLRLDIESSAKSAERGTVAIVPGNPEASELIRRIESTDPDEVMPPKGLHKTIPPEQVARLKAWIRQGASWGQHWSYEPVRRPMVPQNGEPNPIDAFLKERLQHEGLSFSEEADAATRIRRLALDITGLPPTLSELESLREATADEMVAYFLAKPSFGEHWARPWLDLARYADSAGYPSDPGREIWLFRDWVIRALNANMPFDQFTIEQIAGDLLLEPTDDQLIATAFHRNTMTNNEGGTNDEEFRAAAIVDRVNTTFAVWMGTTMACAQCHSHKYDPISIREYFQIYAFLNQTADSDKKDESPLHELISPDVRRQREEWTKEMAAFEKELEVIDRERMVGFEDWMVKQPAVRDRRVKQVLDLPEAERSPAEWSVLHKYYVASVSPATKRQRTEIAKLKKSLDETKPPTVPVMRELPVDQIRKTHVQLRGNWMALGEEVTGGVPAAFPPLPASAPANRLGFARWLVDPANPLTARVAVNRMWESIFGVGIVRSSEEFGSQGDLPEHPALLDWLAAEFMESGWNVKHVLALMFQSRAYRQVSTVSAELNDRDPDNRWLARGPRFRPSGELLRDQALAVSGLLSNKMYGPPVRPVMPNLGLKTAFGQANDWEASQGEDRYRRSVYTEVRRNNPYPSFATFDAPNREVCTIRRGRSNTPLQAFVTLNDPVFVEAQQAFARRMLDEGGATLEAQIEYAFRLTLSRSPSNEEVATLTELHQRARALYQEQPDLASKMVAQDAASIPPNPDHVEHAAWTVIAGVILNLDEFLMRR